MELILQHFTQSFPPEYFTVDRFIFLRKVTAGGKPFVLKQRRCRSSRCRLVRSPSDRSLGAMGRSSASSGRSAWFGRLVPGGPVPVASLGAAAPPPVSAQSTRTAQRKQIRSQRRNAERVVTAKIRCRGPKLQEQG